jgi:hypothetical protein
MTTLRATMWILLAGLCLSTCLPACLPAPALSQVTRVMTVPVTVEGSVEASFHADAQSGCVNPCGLSGSITWSPPRTALLYAYEERHGRNRTLGGSLLFTGSPLDPSPKTTAHVERQGSGACSDVSSRLFSSLDFSVGERSHLNARLTGGGPTTPSVFETRCGGPLDRDLAAALPVRPIDVATLMRGRTTVDLSGERPFASSGLAGTVSSSVRLRLGAPFPVLAAPSRRRRAAAPERRLRTLTAGYRIERVAGSVTTNFDGGSERSLCAPLDACGVSGVVRVAPQVSSGTATFIALAGSRRTTHRQLRAALGLAPGRRVHGLSIFSEAGWARDAGDVAETRTGSDGQTCRDSVPLESGRLTFSFGRRRVFVSYGRGDSFEEIPFRTRCPGPSLVDVAQDHPLATGQVPLRAFRHRRVVIELRRDRRFESEPYTGQTHAALTVVLRRMKVRKRLEAGDGLLIMRRAGGRGT